MITFFSEDRLMDVDGLIRATDSHLAEAGWARGLADRSAARFAARVGDGPPEAGHRVRGEVFRLPYYEGGIGTLRALPRLSSAIWRAVRDTNAVAVRLPGVIGLLAVAVAVIRRRTIVVELVGDIHEVLTTGVGGGLGRLVAPLLRVLTRAAVQRGAVVRYVTQEHLQREYPANRRAEVLAFSDVRLDDSDFDEAVEVEHPTPRIVAVGSQEQPYKGHDLLIGAVADLRREGLDVSLVLLGQGRCQPELRALAGRLGVADHVEFMGHVASREAVVRELDRAWVFAMPSRTEGLPRALVEAMARGKACVVTRVGGMPELVNVHCVVQRDDRKALRDVLRRLLNSHDARCEEGARNKATALELVHQWRSQASDWEVLLGDLSTRGAS